MLLELLLGLLGVLGCLYVYITHNTDYWEKKGVPYIRFKFPLGLMTDELMGREHVGKLMFNYYNRYKSQGFKYVGAFTIHQPTLLLLDLDLCKQVLTKDFSSFMDRSLFPSTHEYLSKNLFFLEGQEWKDIRTKLTPTFTSGKMKNMFVLMEKCAQQLQDHIEAEVLKTGEFEVKDLIARLTTDIIATCAFGLEVNSVKDRENEFFRIGQLIFKPKMSNFFVFFMYKCFPLVSRIMRLGFFEKIVVRVFTKSIQDTVRFRKENDFVRNDFIDLLLKVKENRSLEDNEEDSPIHEVTHKVDPQQQVRDLLTLEQMTAQAFLFFAAGFETAASTTSFCLYELSKNTQVQDRLRREIDEVLSRHEGEICYQALQEMPYMDQVMNEALRMYASLPFLTRVCTQKYRVPGTDLVLDKGVRVNIPTYAIHHDPDIYPDPYTFDPERFSDLNSKDRHHYAFIPFGEGPRNCIGMRFGRLQVKIGLAAILSKYDIAPATDTPSSLEINPIIFFTTPKHPFRLRLSRRSEL